MDIGDGFDSLYNFGMLEVTSTIMHTWLLHIFCNCGCSSDWDCRIKKNHWGKGWKILAVHKIIENKKEKMAINQ